MSQFSKAPSNDIGLVRRRNSPILKLRIRRNRVSTTQKCEGENVRPRNGPCNLKTGTKGKFHSQQRPKYKKFSRSSCAREADLPVGIRGHFLGQVPSWTTRILVRVSSVTFSDNALPRWKLLSPSPEGRNLISESPKIPIIPTIAYIARMEFLSLSTLSDSLKKISRTPDLPLSNVCQRLVFHN